MFYFWQPGMSFLRTMSVSRICSDRHSRSFILKLSRLLLFFSGGGRSGRPAELTLQCVQVHLNSVQSKDVGKFLASVLANAAEEYREMAAAPQCQVF